MLATMNFRPMSVYTPLVEIVQIGVAHCCSDSPSPPVERESQAKGRVS
jgi:hypothetical protein